MADFHSFLCSNTTYGEMSVESAVAYYEYGNALLLKEEENPSNDLLGNVDATASNDSKHIEDEDIDDEDEEAEGETEDHPKAGVEDDEPEGDLQIAWEVLDVARCILERESSTASKSFLSDVYMRLGDLMRFNSNVAASIEEYQKALTIRLSSCAPHDRMISDTHFSLAVAYVYNASEKDSDVDPEQEKMKALSHYKKSQEVSNSYECTVRAGIMYIQLRKLDRVDGLSCLVSLCADAMHLVHIVVDRAVQRLRCGGGAAGPPGGARHAAGDHRFADRRPRTGE